MMLDTLDRAFLDHWSVTRAAAPILPTAAVTTSAAPPPQVAVVSTAAEPAMPPTAPPPIDDSADVVARLLQAAWLEWCVVADEIEAARRRGRRVIAVTSCERGAGCTTLVAGLVRVLTSRGLDATSGTADEAPHGGPTHDRRILLVDAGVWFPPGRIQRRRLLLASVGCDAAILVRREARAAPPGWSVALEAIGVEPLGEVISFAARPAVAAGTGDT
jgi:hypothetical protein